MTAFQETLSKFVAIPAAPPIACTLTAQGVLALVAAVTWLISLTHVAAQSTAAGEYAVTTPGIQIVREVITAADMPVPLQLRVLGRVPERVTYLRVSGLPRGVRLSHGHPLSSEAWSVSPADGEALQIIVPAGLAGKFDISIALVVIDGPILARSRTELVAGRPHGAPEQKVAWPPLLETSGLPLSPSEPKLTDASRPAPAPSDAPRTLISDGTYAAHARAACGEPFQSVLIKVEAGRVLFEHVFRGMSYGWAGAVDETGNVHVTAASLSGTGNFTDKRIELGYPPCSAAPIVLQVRWRTQ